MSILVGDVATLTYKLTVAGVPATATVVLTVTAPGGTVSTPLVTSSAVGTYVATVPASLPGTWIYRWVASGAATDVEDGAYVVVTTQPVTLAQVKAHLKITGTDEDADLTRFLDAAIGHAEDIVGPMTERTVVELHRYPNETIVLRERFASSVTQVRPYSWGGAGVALLPSTYRLDVATGVLRLQNGAIFELEVTYVAGRSTLPEGVKLAILYTVQHAYESQQGSTPTGFGSVDESFVNSRGFAVPNRAKEYLAPYRRGMSLG